MLRAFYKHEYSKEKEEILALIHVYSTVFVLHFELSRLKKLYRSRKSNIISKPCNHLQ